MIQNNKKDVRSLIDLLTLVCIAFNFPSASLALGIYNNTFQADVIDCLNELNVKNSTGFIPSSFGVSSYKALLAELEHEYTELFLNPANKKRIFIYEGPYLHVRQGREGRPTLVTSHIALDVEGYMDKSDFKFNYKNKDSADRMSYELELLIGIYKQYINSKRSEHSKTLLKEFVSKHVDSWMSLFFTDVLKSDEAHHYKHLAFAADSALACEKVIRGNI